MKLIQYLTQEVKVQLHSNIHNITLLETKVHVILRRCVVLTWMHDNKESREHVTLWNNT